MCIRDRKEDDMIKIVDFIDKALTEKDFKIIREEVNEWANKFPLHKK